MLCRIFFLSRPAALALAIFVLLNLFLALENPFSSATRVWLYLQVPEPGLSMIASLLGLALLVPHDAGRHGSVRWLLAGVVFGFCILVGANVIGYYHRMAQGEFRTDFPVPFSLVILTILLAEFARLSWWASVPSRLPPPARVFFSGLLVAGSFFLLISAHIVTFGHTDYRRSADAAVILGAKVYDDGTLSDSLKTRVETGVQLFEQGLVSYLIMSGGVGANGLKEPESMSRYAQDLGVPMSHIILDHAGLNTRQSARNCGDIAREYGFRELLTVSQDYHCARIKLIFEREGIPCLTVPAANGETPRPIVRPSFFLLREVFAYPFYFLYYS